MKLAAQDRRHSGQVSPILKAVVTGAAGFIGCHLVERLVEAGVAVRALDDERTGDWSRLAVPVDRVHADLSLMSEAELLDLCEGAEVVFHLAAEKYNSSRSTPQRIIDVNISATRRLYECAARAGVGHVVFTSSVYAYGSMGPEPMRESDLVAPTTLYGISKVAGEQLLREMRRRHGSTWAVARLFFCYGPRQYAEGGYKSVIVSNFERIERGEPPTVYGDGAQALDYVYVGDAVDCLVRLADAGRHEAVVNVSSGHGVSVASLTESMLRVAGSDLRPVRCPPDWTAGSSRVGSAELAEATLGWRASTPLERGLARVWQWQRHEADARAASGQR